MDVNGNKEVDRMESWTKAREREMDEGLKAGFECRKVFNESES